MKKLHEAVLNDDERREVEMWQRQEESKQANPQKTAKKKKKKNSESSTVKDAQHAPVSLTSPQQRSPKTHRIYDLKPQQKVTAKYTKNGSDSPSKTSKMGKSTDGKPDWTPKISKSNRYLTSTCRKCGEDVYLVPVKLKSGRDSERKYDMKSFEPHHCDGNIDPLDNPRTVWGWGNPKSNPYKR